MAVDPMFFSALKVRGNNLAFQFVENGAINFKLKLGRAGSNNFSWFVYYFLSGKN